MSLDMEKPIHVNFTTVEDLQRIPHVGPKVACAIITLRESHGNLTLDTLQIFLRTKFDAEGGGRVVRWCWVNFQCRGVLQF